MKPRTFTIIKPNAVAAGHSGRILDMILSAGFTIRALRMEFLSRDKAEKFYAVHRGKPFFEKLVIFMTSGPVIVAVLEKENAVDDLRRLVGATDPAKAAEGTIRRLFGDSVTLNAIHASDSDDNARAEWGHFFSDEQIIEADYFLPLPVEYFDK